MTEKPRHVDLSRQIVCLTKESQIALENIQIVWKSDKGHGTIQKFLHVPNSGTRATSGPAIVLKTLQSFHVETRQDKWRVPLLFRAQS